MALSLVENFQPEVVQPTFWTLPEIAGQLVEISSAGASASLTVAFNLVREAQMRGEPVGWATSMKNFFYPRDAAQVGAYLAPLVIVRVPEPESTARAVATLLRSGASVC